MRWKEDGEIKVEIVYRWWVELVGLWLDIEGVGCRGVWDVVVVEEVFLFRLECGFLGFCIVEFFVCVGMRWYFEWFLFCFFW